MIENPKSKEELLKELWDLKLENVSLKTLYEQDITERKQAEETLRESEKRYRMLFEETTGGILIADIETKSFKYANPALCRMLGYTEEELRKLGVEDIHPKQELQRVIAEFKRLARGEINPALDIPCLRKDGRILYADINIANITIDGRLHNVGFFREITERKIAEKALHEQEELFRIISDLTTDYIFSTDITDDGQIETKWILGAYEKITGYSEEEYKSIDHWRMTVHPDDLEKDHSDFQKLLNNENVISEIRTFHKNGNIVWLRTYAHPIWDEKANRLTGVYGAVQDITESKRLELALQESEELFQSLYKNSLIGIYRTSPDGQILLANPTLVKMLGYSTFEELAARDLRREGFETSNSRKLFLEQIEKNGEVKGLESEWIKNDGTVVYIRETARPIRDSEEKTLYYDGTVEDITERKQLDDVLHENEKIFKELFDKAPVGYHELDSQGRVTRINHTELDMFGYTEEEMVGQYVWKFVSDEEKSHQRVLEKLKGLLPPSIGAELDYRRKDLTTFSASVEDVILRDANDNVIGIRTTVQDITNRKKAEQEIQRLNEQLLKSNAEKDKFFSIIAHDLKSPFHGFLGLTQEIIKNANDISIKELTQLGNTMYKAADNLFKLLQNLLEWAQLQSGSISVEPKDIFLTNMIADNIEMIKNRGEQKEISIINKVTDPIHAYADGKMINSVLLNLLSNAVKFTRRSGIITICAKEIEDKMIEISVKDTGVGIPQTIVKKIFNVGEKTGRKGTEGELSTGIGLLLCKEFVEKNNGKIWVESEEGAGSTFYFTLRSCD